MHESVCVSGIHEYYVHYIYLLSVDGARGELALVFHDLGIERAWW